MTLILGMCKQDGIYVSVDTRVSNSKTGAVLDDDDIKFVSVNYPRNEGLVALMTYTGLARLRDGTPTGTWIRETLRGRDDTFDESMHHLGRRLDRDFRRFRSPLIIIVIAVVHNRMFYGGHSNVRTFGPPRELRDFGYELNEIQPGFTFATGSGAQITKDKGFFELMNRQSVVWPRRHRDHMNLLATINKRVAAIVPSVGESCSVMFKGADSTAVKVSPFFKDWKANKEIHLPAIISGLDLTDILSQMVKQHRYANETGIAPSGLDIQTLNRGTLPRP